MHIFITNMARTSFAWLSVTVKKGFKVMQCSKIVQCQWEKLEELF